MRKHGARWACLNSWILGFSILSIASQASAEPKKRADPYELLDQLGEAISVIEEEYYEPADQSEMLQGALQGLVGGLDPHSTYFNREDRKVFEGSTAGKFGGIGVEVEFSDGEITVIAPVEGSPADRAGILPGDRIIALDGRRLRGEKPHDIVRMMRGKIGTKLRLTVRSKRDGVIRDISVEREQISVSSVRAQLMVGGIAYFRIKAFQEATHSELLEALGDLREEAGGALHGIILDLRNNPGGLVREATAVADEFLPGGIIYSTRHRGRTLRIASARSGGAWTQGPVAVLINEYSASAAELVAGALGDRGRARLIGAQTFGKGSVQTVLNLGHGGALKLTTALYYTPSGETTQAKGVKPHIFVNPGYVGANSALSEADLKGHVKGGKQKAVNEPVMRGTPPSNDELHLGVARTIPRDPRNSPDLALSKAHELLTGTTARDSKTKGSGRASQTKPTPAQKKK